MVISMILVRPSLTSPFPCPCSIVSLRKNSSSGSHWLSSTIVTLTYINIVIDITIININLFVNIIIFSNLLLLLVRLKGEGLTDGDVVLSLVGRTVNGLHPDHDDDEGDDDDDDDDDGLYS